MTCQHSVQSWELRDARMWCADCCAWVPSYEVGPRTKSALRSWRAAAIIAWVTLGFVISWRFVIDVLEVIH